ncbi:MAG: thioesterase [Thermotogota bacterium]|nr:thioesterase [Thermotogota bacterium]
MNEEIETYRVRYHEIDKNWKLTLKSILNYFNDVVTLENKNNPQRRKYLQASDLNWLLLKWHIKLNGQQPIFGDTITARTWPHAMDRYYAYRKFDLSFNNETIVKANSLWLLIDSKKKKPVRINSKLTNFYKLSGKEKPISFASDNINKSNKYSHKEFIAIDSDIDTNQHVNNVVYIRWILDSLPELTYRNYSLNEVTISYKKEVLVNECVTVSSYSEKKGQQLNLYHEMLKNNETVVTAKTLWIKT